MEKINMPLDIEMFYLREISNYFKRNKTFRYKEIAKIIKKNLGLSFKKLLILKPDEIINLINSTPISFSDADKKIMEDLYKNFRSSISSKNLLEKINLNVCPYCNRNFIFNFNKKDSKEATAQLDHFFDKSTYPYLSISLYNLVPSCSTCNQRKSKKDSKEIFYPYKESFNQNAKFVYGGIKTNLDKQNIDFFDEKRIKLDIKHISEETKVENHNEVFNIENLYENHKDIVKELLQKRVMYSDSYIDELFDKYSGILFSSKEELMRLITCGYISDDDINKRPLSKLIKDISEDLGFR